jgi:hypothetical protein
MTRCAICEKPLDSSEKRLFDDVCRECIINEIKTHVEDLEKGMDTTKRQRKPSNIIYVVNRPQPGQVRGDWAVRGHGKIFSYHRTQGVAIQQARKIARQRGATVMVQRTNGTFSRGFKPRTKKQ